MVECPGYDGLWKSCEGLKPDFIDPAVITGLGVILLLVFGFVLLVILTVLLFSGD